MKLKEIEYGLSGIYKITFDNDKVYIGLSNDIRRRMIEHYGRDLKEYPNLLISQAIMKHKTKDIEIIEYIDENDRELLKEREIYWIAYYNSYLDRTKGYNMTPGGDGVLKGIYNNASYISQQDLEQIINLLQNSDLTYDDIADITNSSKSIIQHINLGIHYRDNKITYPIRKKRKEHYELNNKHSAFFDKQEELLNLIQDLKNNQLSYKELEEKYNIKTTTLSLINQGKKYKQDNEIYPLRKSKTSLKRIFSKDELELIKNLLNNSNKSMTEIGKILSCDRKIISDINNGIRQRQDNWSYPLRNIPLKTGPKTKTS